jgi:hypothetical protein
MLIYLSYLEIVFLLLCYSLLRPSKQSLQLLGLQSRFVLFRG